ncbi:hypothetical protein OS493_009475 [Desmophyllum pertusum]|uniref:Uncharacterized protein n=1 Tax=Desmophyllum pertusum TaxID=174260 RepID=A0A9W9Z5G4_9CNID|nr:hypothetical protein OS493_009475 [Desmophyllum pertusum]
MRRSQNKNLGTQWKAELTRMKHVQQLLLLRVDCSSTLDNNPTEQLSTNSSCSTDSSCTTLVNDSVDGIPNDSHQTSSICDTVKLPCASSNCSQLSENSSRKSSSDEDLTSQLSSPNECRTSNVSSGSNGAKYTNVLIDVERLHMDRLSSLPSDSWNINNDLVLVHFLCDIHEKSNQGRCKGWFKAECAIPELFSKTSIMNYPSLSCFSAEKVWWQPNTVSKINEDLSESDVKLKEEDNRQQEENLKKIKASAQVSHERYKEQLKSVKKKIHFIEEQKQLVHNIREQEFALQELTFDLDVVDAKLQRNELFLKQQKQENYKSNLLALLKKLKEDEKQLVKKVECSVEASKQEVIDLPQSSSSVVQPAYKIPQQPAELSQKWSVRPPSSQENDSSNSMRYNLSSLSPKLRFLLPLCNQRWRLVQELLHTTELSAPDYMPVITVDRRVPLIERHADSRNSVFLQVYYELRGEKLHFRWNKWKYDQWWEVKFVGEGIIDQGGGFRDSLAELSDELCPPEERIPDILPYLIRTPNHKEKTGDFLDCFIPNPCCDALHMFRWLGSSWRCVSQ